MRERIKIAALIVYYNSGRDFGDCVTSLQGEVDVIYVLENASTEIGVRERLGLEYGARSDLRLVYSENNLGFGGGINLLSQLAIAEGASHLWFVNPDCVVATGAAEKLVENMGSNGLALASPLIMTGSRSSSTIWFSGGQLDMKRGLSEHIVSPPGGLAPVACSFLTGAAMMTRVDAWVELGGFRTDLFMYWEDADLCIRAAALGLRMAVVPAAITWHREGGSSGDHDSGHSKLYYYYMTRNRLAIHVGFLTRCNILFARGLWMTARLFASGFREQAGRPGKILSCVKGSLDGLFY